MAMQQNSRANASGGGGSTVDPAEIAKFSKLSEEWWDPRGKMAPLHKINPLRLTYIRACASSISVAARACCASRSPVSARS
jgi:2-polyprenyl-6-hydroxyphenyl methylase/3-demethylubiquinone-9 3-methyltransferase